MQLTLEIVRLVDLLVQAIMLEHEQHGTLGFLETVVEVDAPIKASRALPTMESWMSSRRILAWMR